LDGFLALHWSEHEDLLTHDPQHLAARRQNAEFLRLFEPGTYGDFGVARNLLEIVEDNEAWTTFSERGSELSRGFGSAQLYAKAMGDCLEDPIYAGRCGEIAKPRTPRIVAKPVVRITQG
jgi:hypothetical protein